MGTGPFSAKGPGAAAPRVANKRLRPTLKENGTTTAGATIANVLPGVGVRPSCSMAPAQNWRLNSAEQKPDHKPAN